MGDIIVPKRLHQIGQDRDDQPNSKNIQEQGDENESKRWLLTGHNELILPDTLKIGIRNPSTGAGGHRKCDRIDTHQKPFGGYPLESAPINYYETKQTLVPFDGHAAGHCRPRP